MTDWSTRLPVPLGKRNNPKLTFPSTNVGFNPQIIILLANCKENGLIFMYCGLKFFKSVLQGFG